MSLINDAIKQANKANKERTPAGASPVAPPTAGMHSADTRVPPPASGSLSGMLIVAGIVVFVLLGGSLLLLALRGTRLTTDLDNPALTETVPPARPLPAPQSIGAVPSSAPAAASPAQEIAASVLTNPVPAPSTEALPPTANLGAETGIPPVVQAAVPRPFPELKLQGIYYRLKDPSVMINGKTFEIGDLILDAKVIKIDRREVTLEFDGQQKVLRLQ